MRRESLKYKTRQDMTIGAKQGREGHGEERERKCDRLRREPKKKKPEYENMNSGNIPMIRLVDVL